jgi:hypothetical protein
MITIKIDVSKIDKSRLYKGKKGTYLSAVLIPTPDSEYGDFMIVEEVSKEERDAGKKGTILGNGKNLVKKAAEPPEPSVDYSKNSMTKEQILDDTPTDTDNLPFIITIFLAVGTLLPYLF